MGANQNITYIHGAVAPTAQSTDFATAHRDLKEAHHALGHARIKAHDLLSAAIREARELQEQAQGRLNETMGRFIAAGGQAEDAGEIHESLHELHAFVLRLAETDLNEGLDGMDA